MCYIWSSSRKVQFLSVLFEDSFAATLVMLESLLMFLVVPGISLQSLNREVFRDAYRQV